MRFMFTASTVVIT